MLDSEQLQAAPPNFVIITGLSGSGMSSATNAFEDLGYFCVDNLPVTMLSTFTRLMVPNRYEKAAIEKAALVIDIREGHFLSGMPEELRKARKKLNPFVLFFEASDEVIARRFSETRRPHPADSGGGLLEAIRDERRMLEDVRKEADLVIDTSGHTVHTLRKLLLKSFGAGGDGSSLQIEYVSFGHKYGVPNQVDLLFDVRHLPNPFFEKGLRELPGTDAKVIEFLSAKEDVSETLQRFWDLLSYLLPLYRREGKSYLTVGIGCTGGRHRSVFMAENLSRLTAAEGGEVVVTHRDLSK
jgi:UPF0042 nucleotide-binding protein